MKRRRNIQQIIATLYYVVISIFILTQIFLVIGVSRVLFMQDKEIMPFIPSDLREVMNNYPPDTIFGFMSFETDIIEANYDYRRAMNSVIPYLVIESDSCCRWVIAYGFDAINNPGYRVAESLESNFSILENLAYIENNE